MQQHLTQPATNFKCRLLSKLVNVECEEARNNHALRPFDRVSAHLVFPLHALHVDVQVELAHAADDGLPTLSIHAHLEGGVLLGEPVQGL